MAKARNAVNHGYEEGKTYRSFYWGKNYTVIAVHGPGVIPWSAWAVTVRWADGSETTHCTLRDPKKDREVAA